MVEQRERRPASDAQPSEALTLSGEPLEPLYGPEDLAGFDPEAKLGRPGAYPFTRGVYPTMYRGRLWTMRQFAGFGSAAETNARYRFLLERGQGGLSVAFDMPTLMGRDSDDPLAEGEVGRCGVATDTLEDFDALFDGIPLGDISTSMTISGPAVVVFAYFLAAAERQGVPWERLDGTLQTDILKEYIAQKEWNFPPRPHLRLIGDLMAFCLERVPRWHPISVSGYHIREAGANAWQELAYTLADGFAYVELGLDRGLDVDRFAPGLSFFFNAHVDFFEEIAKYRAARRIWARWLKERYGAKDESSMRLRFHTQTAGVSLTAQQPMNNVVRTTIEALAAVLGGTQSLHTNALDEVLALPTEEAAKLALRTQQIIAHETGVPDVIDPLGGSYFLETLTDRMEELAEAEFARILAMGEGSMLEGVLTGIERGVFQQAIAESAFREQERFERGDLVKVGVTDFVEAGEQPIEILEISGGVETDQVERVRDVRERRDTATAHAALDRLRELAATDANLVEPLVDCARALCTEGEIVEALRGVFGSYTETPRVLSGPLRPPLVARARSCQKLRQRAFMRSSVSGKDRRIMLAAHEALGVGVIVSAFLFGFRHGIDWDHIAAITDITSSQEERGRALEYGTIYALGHALVVFVIGVAAIVLGAKLPDGVDAVMERVVGVTLDPARRLRVHRAGAARARVPDAQPLDADLQRRPGRVPQGPRGTRARGPRPRARPPARREEPSMSVTVAEDIPVSEWHHGHHGRPGHHHHKHPEPGDDAFMNYGRGTAFGVGMLHGVGAETPTQVVIFLTAAGAGGASPGSRSWSCSSSGCSRRTP